MTDADKGAGQAGEVGAAGAVQAGLIAAELAIVGPAAEIGRFRERARGPKAVPWHVDHDHEEARLMALLAGAGRSARRLVATIRQEQEAQHARVLAAATLPGGGCPLDLHRLLPVPARLLALGADAPESRHWLLTHWGTVEPLRQVTLRERRDRDRHRLRWLVYGLWSVDRLPEPAVARLQVQWPTLQFELRSTAATPND